LVEPVFAADIAHRHNFDDDEIEPLVAAPGDEIVEFLVVDAAQRDRVVLDRETGPLRRRETVEHLLALEPAETAALAPRLKDLVMPTSIVTGAHDPFITASVAERLKQEIPGATLDVIPDVRHFTPEEAPERIAGAIGDLLKR
jgi:pimeloyl-ACP methyl ester carboxylesterase